MQFTRFLSALSIASFAVALPLPVAVVKQRKLPNVQDVLGALQTQVHSILAQLDATVQDGGLTQAVVGPIVDDLVGALDTTAADLGNLIFTVTSPVGGLPIKRETVDPQVIGDILGLIITEVNQTLDNLVSTAEQIPGVAILLIGLNTSLISLNTSLTQVISLTETLVPGVRPIVIGLVDTLTSTFDQLLDLGSLGL